MQKRRFGPILATFIPCYLFWLLLTMSLQPIELIYGLLVCGVTAWFAAGFFAGGQEKPFKYLNPLRVLTALFYFCIVFLWELICANCAMAAAVFSGRQPRHAVVRVPVRGISDPYGLAILADCITLTPGTITLDVTREGEDGYSMYVQWMDPKTEENEEAGRLIKGRMEKWIGRICK